MFTARYGLIPYIEQIAFRLLKVKGHDYEIRKDNNLRRYSDSMFELCAVSFSYRPSFVRGVVPRVSGIRLASSDDACKLYGQTDGLVERCDVLLEIMRTLRASPTHIMYYIRPPTLGRADIEFDISDSA